MKKFPGERLVSLIPPAVPIWGAFYAEEAPDNLLILPVLGLALVEKPQECDHLWRKIIPLVFDRLDGISSYWETDEEVLGFLLKEELPRAAEIFADEIVERAALWAANRKRKTLVF